MGRTGVRQNGGKSNVALRQGAPASTLERNSDPVLLDPDHPAIPGDAILLGHQLKVRRQIGRIRDLDGGSFIRNVHQSASRAQSVRRNIRRFVGVGTRMFAAIIHSGSRLVYRASSTHMPSCAPEKGMLRERKVTRSTWINFSATSLTKCQCTERPGFVARPLLSANRHAGSGWFASTFCDNQSVFRGW